MTEGPKRILWRVLGIVMKRASRNYIAGPALADAMRVSQALVGRGYGITLGYWDAARDDLEHVRQAYLDAVDALSRLGTASYLSIKLPALRYDAEAFAEVHARTRRLGIDLMFDALDEASAAPTLEFIARRTDPSAGGIGCVLPGRWRRSLADAERAIELGLTVRVVKGQSPDPTDPDRDPAAGALAVVNALAGRARCVRVASHDPVLARASLEHLSRAGTRCELELLYGLPVGEQVRLAREFGVPVRVYVAYGHAFLPYALASLRKRPADLLRLLREMGRGDRLATFPHVRSGDPVPPVA